MILRKLNTIPRMETAALMIPITKNMLRRSRSDAVVEGVVTLTAVRVVMLTAECVVMLMAVAF